MVTKQEAYDIAYHYRGQYEYMIESNHPEDVANAEACRLGCHAWQDIAANINKIRDHGDLSPDWDVENTINEMINYWNIYCETGIPRNDVQEMADDLAADHQRTYIEPKIQVVTTPVTVVEPKKKKKITSENPIDAMEAALSEAIQMTEPIATKVVNQNVLDYLNPRAVDGIIAGIRERLGVEAQEAEAMRTS